MTNNIMWHDRNVLVFSVYFMSAQILSFSGTKLS